MVVVAVPLAVTGVGEAVMLPEAADGTSNVRVAVWDNCTPSVMSVAEKVTLSATRLVMANTTAPLSVQ